jgi:hypothetical protein
MNTETKLQCGLCKQAEAQYELSFGPGGFHATVNVCKKCATKHAGPLDK